MSLLKTGDGQARGPDLLGKAGAAGVRIEAKGILSQLEHGVAAPAAMPALRWRPGWRHGAVGALCLAVLITAVFAYDTEVLPRPRPRPAAPATAMAPPAVPAPTVPPQAAQAATIVNTAAPPLPEAAATSAPRKTPPPVRQAAARPQGTRPAAAPGDSDVALLTAMVAHAHRQEGTAAPVRDVVLRRQKQEQEQEQETAELLRRCKQLGLIEGMLCRSRICSGRWDSDPACH
ncbi:hypothetical protein O0881_08270 [Janthinobacterium sp. SUN100]|uniref:hypothetical protein n=1 Tax=Janthinobacterium sp. SUN100 TaxID=3004101 RepID=UPI0025AFF700|nr:hypothetical protein [Janthinobacterium sp. SUN100]MDN2701987.1 hypothetical protein [Janthinobacterium sp. SUN100]